MLLSFGFLLCSGLFSSNVFGHNTDPNSLSTRLSRTSYARGNSYGCSDKFFKPHCWKYCTGNSGKWCYTVDTFSNSCSDDYDCRYSEACQGWCAWNSQSGCSKACHEEVAVPAPQMQRCRRGQPYWDCQSSFGGYGWRGQIATGGKWISPDIPNEHVGNSSAADTILFNGHTVTSTKESDNVPQTALWFPMGQIKTANTKFYWTFTIRETGTSSASNVFIGISDLNKLAPGWGVKGLFYGGNLSDGSGLLIEKFGPTLKTGDKFSILVEVVDKKIKLYFILNDTSLGLGFLVPENTLDGIYPVVKFNGKGSVEIAERVVSDAPTELEPARPLMLEGNWTLRALGDYVTSETKATVKITKIYDRVYDRAFRLRIHALNKFMGKLMEKSTSNWIAEILDKTSLQGTASEMELETKLSKHIAEITNVVLDVVKSELRLESLDSTSVWKQIEPKLRTVNWNPFAKKVN